MRPRVSKDALEALLRKDDPAPAVNPVTDSERAALLARLSEEDFVAALPRRRRSGAPMVGVLLVSALCIAIFWPREVPRVVLTSVSPSPSPVFRASSSGSQSAMPDFSASSSVRHSSLPPPKREAEARETHLVIVADDTCAVTVTEKLSLETSP